MLEALIFALAVFGGLTAFFALGMLLFGRWLDG